MTGPASQVFIKALLKICSGLGLVFILGSCGLLNPQTILNTPSYNVTGTSWTMSSGDGFTDTPYTYGVTIYYKIYTGSSPSAVQTAYSTDLNGFWATNNYSAISAAAQKYFPLYLENDVSSPPNPTFKLSIIPAWTVTGDCTQFSSSGTDLTLGSMLIHSTSLNTVQYFRYDQRNSPTIYPADGRHKRFRKDDFTVGVDSDLPADALSATSCYVGIVGFTQAMLSDLTTIYSQPVSLGLFEIK